MRVVMRKKLSGFSGSLNPPLMLRLWGMGGQASKAGETFRGVERGRVDFGDFCCCKHGKNRPPVFLSDS